ncbi:MAG: hypothetical protein JHC38_08085 [Thiotrichales bacterium]|jgi:hypothetical protein|nr:hypothetical protein [Thiotrichales bacterium]
MNHPTQAGAISGVNRNLSNYIIAQTIKYHDVSTMKERLIDALKRHGTLTVTACGKYDINNVAQRIAELRKDGWIIETKGKGRGKETTYTLIGFNNLGAEL